MVKIAQGKQQTLQDILIAREKRVELQRQLLAQYQNTLISYKLNIPGGVKDNMLIRKIFAAGIGALQQKMQAQDRAFLYGKAFYKPSGPEFFGVLADSAPEIKAITCEIEEGHSLGRLYDFDVIAADGRACSREDIGKSGRRCFLCPQPAFSCARSRTHSVEEMLIAIQNMADAYFGQQAEEV
jgi:holo-ACP synthase